MFISYHLFESYESLSSEKGFDASANSIDSCQPVQSAWGDTFFGCGFFFFCKVSVHKGPVFHDIVESDKMDFIDPCIMHNASLRNIASPFPRLPLISLFCSPSRRKEGYIALLMSVGRSVRWSVGSPYLVRMITRHRIDLGSTNLAQTCCLGM